jgi:hypothetical protein
VILIVTPSLATILELMKSQALTLPFQLGRSSTETLIYCSFVLGPVLIMRLVLVCSMVNESAPELQ